MKVKYSHPAVPPQGINISDIYEIELLLKLGLTKDMIDMLFTVVEEKKEIKKNNK